MGSIDYTFDFVFYKQNVGDAPAVSSLPKKIWITTRLFYFQTYWTVYEIFHLFKFWTMREDFRLNYTNKTWVEIF